MNPQKQNNPISAGSTTDTFYVLDFDRCLGHTEKFQELLESIIERWAVVDLEMIRYAHRQVKKTGGSFDTAAYVRQVLNDRQMDGTKVWQAIEKEFVVAARKEDLFEPHARDLLQVLDSRSAHYGILTYGGHDWQTAKIKAAGLQHIPHLITSNQEKGRLLASWQQPEGGFIIPRQLSGDKEIRTSRLVFVDDKPVSFDGIPAGVQGICVSPMATAGQIERLPTNVAVVQGMEQAIGVLFGTGAKVIDKA